MAAGRHRYWDRYRYRYRKSWQWLMLKFIVLFKNSVQKQMLLGYQMACYDMLRDRIIKPTYGDKISIPIACSDSDPDSGKPVV